MTAIFGWSILLAIKYRRQRYPVFYQIPAGHQPDMRDIFIDTLLINTGVVANHRKPASLARRTVRLLPFSDTADK